MKRAKKTLRPEQNKRQHALVLRVAWGLMGVLSVVAGSIWFVANKPGLEPVTVICGGLAVLLGGVDISQAKSLSQGKRGWALAIGGVVTVIGLGLFVWGVTRAFQTDPPEAPSEIDVLRQRARSAYVEGRYSEALNYLVLRHA